MTEFDFDAAAGKEPPAPDTEGVLQRPEAATVEQPAAGFDFSAAAPAPQAADPDAAIFDFDAAAGAAEVEEPTFRKITDPLGRPLKVQPPERQWSAMGTPLPGTEAAVMGAEIHPLSRAVLQNFDLTEDIPGNRAALKKILRGVYGPNIALNRAAPLPVDDLTDEQLAKYVELPQVQRALQKDSVTRRRMAEKAEDAAILRGEIPIMLAAEGQVDTMMRMLMDPEQRSVAAQMAQQNRGVIQGIVNTGKLGAIETIEGFKMKRAMGTQGVAEAARTNAWDTFVNAFTNQNFQGFIDSQYASGLLLGDLAIWTPLDLIYGAGAGIGKVLDVYRAGGFNEETAARLEQQAYKDFAAAVKTLRRAAAEYPSSARGANFMRQVEEAESDFAVFRLMFEDPAGAAAVTGEVFARNAPVLAASAATRGVIGPKTAMTVATMGQFVMEDVRLDELRAEIVKEKTGHDLNTNVGIQAFLKDPDAQRIYSAYGTDRARAISLTQLLTFGIYRGGTFIPSKSLTAKLAERTVVSGALEGVGEGLAGLSATGELDVREAAVEAALGFGQGLPTTLIEGYVSGATDLKTASEARRAKEWLKGTQDLKGTIGGIDVVKLDTAASVLGEKLEEQGIDTVYITASPLDRLDQDGSLSETLGLNRDDVKQAAAEGDMVEVTASAFIRHILGADGFEALMEHTSYELGALTPAEAQQYEDAGIGDQIQQQIEDRARARMSPAIDDQSMEQLNTDMNDIRDQVSAQLEATGRYDAAKSRAFGLLTAQRYATRAIRITEETGQPIDARALFEADNLQITGRARVQSGQAMLQDVINLEDVRQRKELEGVHGQLTEAIKQRARESIAAAEAHEWSVDVGEKIMTESGIRDGSAPWTVVGRIIKEKGLSPDADPRNGVFTQAENVPYLLIEREGPDGVEGTLVPEWAVARTFRGPSLAQAALFQEGLTAEEKRQTKQDERVADKNAHGLMPYLRDYSDAEPRRDKKQALVQDTKNNNAREQLSRVDEILALNPDAHTSVEAWLQMMADAYGVQDVPIAPYRFIEEINGQGSIDNLARLTPGQIADADHGFENAAAFREAYTSGKLSVETTAKLFLWSFLSRGVSPYTQEGLFIDAFPGIDPWLVAAASGTFDFSDTTLNLDLGVPEELARKEAAVSAANELAWANENKARKKKKLAPLPKPNDFSFRRNDDGTVNLTFTEWAKSVAPAGAGQPGAGATHNLNAFGRDFLVKMSQDVGDGTGRSRLQYIHDLMADPNSTGQQVRREFAAVGEGVGIDNKVVSFTLLVAGFDDVLVLDRVQFRQMYNDGRFDGVNLYDGFKTEGGKAVTGSGLAKQGDGARGILIYEAMERAVSARIDEIYSALGREGQGSVGRYHWETWVADSQQEASHGSLGAILPAALGDKTAIHKVAAKQGEYGSYAYGARYGVDGSGISYFTYPTPSGTVWLFTVDQFVEFQQEVKKAGNGVVPTKFKVTEAGNAPWYNNEAVNVEALDQLAERISSGPAGDGAGTLFQDGSDQLISDRLPAGAALAQQQEVDFVGDVIFEVAPDPNDVELSSRWNALPAEVKLSISDAVAKSVLPSVLRAAGAKGSVFSQIGSYLDDTNPSFSLRLTSGDPAAVARAVGFVLSQDSMVALSADAFDGSFEAGAIRIQVGDKNLQELDAIYQTLRGIEGFPQIGGQSTTDGQMTLILDEGVDVAAFADAVVKALPSEYNNSVLFDTVNVSFPEKEDYDYASPENDPAGAEGVARQRYRAVRDQASREVASAIGRYEQGGQQPSLAQQQAAGQQPARGGFTPADLITDQEGNPVNLLQIFEKADTTTFLHESGHFWLEQLKADADAVKGQFDRDWSAVKDWWASRPLELREEAVRRAKKAKDKDAVAALQKMTEAQVATYARTGELRGEGTQRYLSVAMHEQFARGVEDYFATGRAPSLSLADIFSKFRIWVSSVYARLAGAKLDVQFSPEVTAVIDRMLAADEEIALIEGQYALTPLYNTASEAGMTPTQFAEYQRKTADARNERRARQLSKHVKELQRTQTEKWKQAKERLLPEVRQEVAAQPAYRLLYALTQQGLADGSVLAKDEAMDRMDRALLKELLEAEGFSLDNIPRVDSKAIYEEGGVSPAIVATAFGYEDVDAMILDLVDREPYAFAVERAVETRLEEEFGSIELSGEADALASAHSEQTGRVLAMELEALRTTEPAFKQQFVRAYAKQRLLDMPSAQVRPYRFLAAQNKHAKLAGIALKRGDRVEAYQHQFQRLVNHYMAAEALKAQRDIEKKTKYLRGFTRPGRKFGSFEYGYADSILRILAAVNFSQGAAGQQSRAAQINALQEFIEEKHAADGSMLDVPEWLVDTSGGTANNIGEMSYLRFLQLHETIKRYEQQARAAKKIRVGTEDQDREVAKAELLAALAGRDVSRVNKLRGKAASAGGAFYTAAAVTALADAQLLKVEALLEAIDGKPLGAWHQTIYEPFSQAAAQKYDLQAEVSQLVGELIEALPKDVRKSFGKPVDVGALGKPGMRVTRGNLIMLALNVGNESNLDKLIRGMGGDPDNSNVKSAGWNISEELIDTALEQLTEQEWDLVQAIWGHAEKLFPAVEAIYGREHGIAPDRVVPRTVKTKFGDIKGGYFPMMYDRTIAGVATDLSQKTALELIQAEVGRATINSSMTKARTGYAAPVDLDISRLALGLDNTIHFITHYEAVRNANKILGDKDVRAELETKVGLAYTDQLVKWVAALASNGNDSPPVDIIQKGIQQLYNNTTVAVLGFSYSTLAMQTLGLLNGQDRMLADTGYGPISIAQMQKDLAAGVAAAARPQHVRYVMEVSGEMRARRKSMDREVSQVLRNLAGKEGVLTGAQRFSMEAIAQVQFYTVDIPVWTAAYNRALRADPADTESAVRYADRVVRLSQSAGGLKDLAAVQRHKGIMKGMTMFYSFFSALYATLRGLGVEFTDGVRQNPVAATTRAATRLFVLLALQSVATGLIREELPEMEPEDEDAQTLLRYIVAESAATALGPIPLIREVAAGMASGYGYNGGAGNIAFEAGSKSFQGLTKYIDELGEEEFVSDEGDWEARARIAQKYVLLVSVLFKLPGVQINRTADGLAAYFDEADDWNWTDLVRGYSAERAERRQ